MPLSTQYLTWWEQNTLSASSAIHRPSCCSYCDGFPQSICLTSAFWWCDAKQEDVIDFVLDSDDEDLGAVEENQPMTNAIFSILSKIGGGGLINNSTYFQLNISSKWRLKILIYIYT